MQISDLVALLETLAPPSWAEDWDSLGLQVGRPDLPLSAVLVALDLTDAVLDRAAAEGAELIVTHHPFLFRPLPAVRTDQPSGRRLARLLAEGRSLYVAHTNLDASPTLSPAAILADRLNLRDTRPLLPVAGEGSLKLVTFLPVEHVEPLRAALADAGAGIIGDYRECSFEVAGTGHFRAPHEAHPAVGQAGAENRVPEVRLEMILPAAAGGRVIEALRGAHPYEEPAFDLYPLQPPPGPAGIGRLGRLPQPLSCADLAAAVAEITGSRCLHWTAAATVRTVALLPGSGKSALAPALAAGADVLITGELDYHPAAEAADRGLAVIAAGHAESEAPALAALADALRRLLGPAPRVLWEPPAPLWLSR